MPRTHGRHTPAFLLLFLAESPAYGASLLTRLQNELPHCFSDSAIVYRTLQELEKNGLVETQWEMRESGQPRKWYTITTMGKEALVKEAEDVRQRHSNFEFFLARLQTLKLDSQS